MSLLDDIRRAVDAGIKQAGLYRTATLVKSEPGTRIPGDLASGTQPTSSGYPCRGMLAGYDAKTIAVSGTLIQSNDRKITIIGGSLPSGIAPDKNDQVTIQDIDGVSRTFRIVESPDVDEAGGAFICQGRR